MTITLNVQNEQLFDKVLWLLNHLENSDFISRMTQNPRRRKGFGAISKAIIVELPLEVAITATDIVKDVATIGTESSKVLKANAKAWHDQSISELDIESEVRKELKDSYAKAYKAQIARDDR